MYTINEFWKSRLNIVREPSSNLIAGWSYVREGLATFKEAPLTVNADMSGGTDPAVGEIILVSAPGAVGKSTLAKQIAYITGAVYLNLAEANPVGANTIVGGLVKSGLYDGWQNQQVALLVDGLDEARLRVTQEGFEAFLEDIVSASKERTLPTVLFGRTGAVQDAWIFLSQANISAAVLEIGYYGPVESIEFVEALLSQDRTYRSHEDAEHRAVGLLLERLREQTESDGDRFAGYAPVLQAVAKRVSEEKNPAALIAQIEKGGQPVTLQSVGGDILERERRKLNPLVFEDNTLKHRLYLPNEQLDRLVSRVYGLPTPEFPPMSAKDTQTYTAALGTWVNDHPFLNGGKSSSSAVFDALIASHALQGKQSEQAAIQRELGRGAAANPFLAEFYTAKKGDSGHPYLPPEHIGLVYASLRASLSLGEAASLNISGIDKDQENSSQESEDLLRAEVEITLDRPNQDRSRVMRFESSQVGMIRLGGYIEDIEVSLPYAQIEIGAGAEAVIVAPISIQCHKLSVVSPKVVVESPRGLKEQAAFLEAEAFEGGLLSSVPVVRGDVSLSASWPGVRSYPWTNFAAEPTPIKDPKLDEALRRFRKFVIAFRSHSKGALARYKAKLEHERMTKGAGQAVLDLLRNEEIVYLVDQMYYLDPDRLGSETGATYADCMSRKFSEKTIDFVRRAL